MTAITIDTEKIHWPRLILFIILLAGVTGGFLRSYEGRRNLQLELDRLTHRLDSVDRELTLLHQRDTLQVYKLTSFSNVLNGLYLTTKEISPVVTGKYLRDTPNLSNNK